MHGFLRGGGARYRGAAVQPRVLQKRVVFCARYRREWRKAAPCRRCGMATGLVARRGVGLDRDGGSPDRLSRRVVEFPMSQFPMVPPVTLPSRRSLLALAAGGALAAGLAGCALP